MCTQVKNGASTAAAVCAVPTGLRGSLGVRATLKRGANKCAYGAVVRLDLVRGFPAALAYFGPKLSLFLQFGICLILTRGNTMIESYVQFFKICEGIKDRRTVVDVWKNRKLECLGRIGRAGLGWFEVETGNGTVAVDLRGSEI